MNLYHEPDSQIGAPEQYTKRRVALITGYISLAKIYYQPAISQRDIHQTEECTDIRFTLLERNQKYTPQKITELQLRNGQPPTTLVQQNFIICGS